jgi:ribonuclease E
MKKEMLINVLQPEECRIAIVEDGILEELYVERTSHESYTGNIYKGKVVNLEPAIQAAFIDFSVGRNGFLHVSDVEPQYYRRQLDDDAEAAPRDKAREPRPARDPGEDRDRPPRGPRSPEDRARDRERPDRSEKGRRDRSAERRFGEGLVEEWEAPPPPRPVAPAPPPAARRHEPEPVPPPQPEPHHEPAAVEARSEPDFDDLIGWKKPARREVAPRERDRPEPAEPRARTGRATPAPTHEDAAEVDLPPSRTQRARPSRASEPEALADEPIESFRPRRSRPEPVEPPRARAVEPERAPEPEPEPRAGWGRGRTPSAASPPPASRVEREPDLEPEFAPEPIEDESSRPRGRSAIRSRGGDRPAERPRPREREVEQPRHVAESFLPPAEPVEPPARPAPADREREPEREPRGRPPRGRSRPAAEPEAPRAPHGRAGEPGYVPRHKRLASDPDPIAPAARRPVEDDLLDDVDAEPEGDLEAGDDAPDRPGDGPKRRRRRRGRRRERTEPEAKAAPVDDLDVEPADDLDDDFEDLDEPAVPPAAPARPLSGPRRGPDREPPPARRAPVDDHDDFDFGDEPDDDEDDDDDEEFRPRSGREAAAVLDPDDEVDPELQEEIRREIEEIAELELEMGLRATTEARPRRGDAPSGPGGRSPRGGRGLSKPPLQDIFRRGDEVLVQVIKESIGTKGPTLSTYISIPGRYLVLMPGLARVGVSRKIADEGQRRRLREIMTALNPPKGLGFIVRTAGLDRTKKELARDLAYLLRLWKVILRRIKKAKAPAPIYQESDMITRTIRDIFNAEIDTIWIDEPQAFERAQEFLRVVMPKFVDRLKFYDDKVPLFHKYGLEAEIVKIQRRRVEMPEGGSIVIDPTEALVAIDVNSGNFRFENDPERTAYEMNLKAAKEIARQLRLRDLGGVICNDFIDMRDEKNRRGVEKALRDAIKRDRARTKVLRMSQFGVIEMTRQRIRPSLKRSVYEDCPECTGAGVVKTVESMSIDVMRLLALASHREDIRRVNISVCPDVATYLNNRKRKEIAKFEGEGGAMIYIHPEPDAPREHLQVDCFDAQNGEVRLLPAPPPPPRRGR